MHRHPIFTAFCAILHTTFVGSTSTSSSALRSVTACLLSEHLADHLPPWVEIGTAHKVLNARDDTPNFVVTFHVRVLKDGASGSWRTELCAGVLSDTSDTFLRPLYHNGVRKVDQLRCLGEGSLIIDGKPWNLDETNQTITTQQDFSDVREMARLGVIFDGSRAFNRAWRHDLPTEVKGAFLSEKDVSVDAYTYIRSTARNFSSRSDVSGSSAGVGTVSRLSSPSNFGKLRVGPVSVSVSEFAMSRYMEWQLPTEMLHSCLSFEIVPSTNIITTAETLGSSIETNSFQHWMLETFSEVNTTAVLFDGQAKGKLNLQDTIADAMEASADPDGVSRPSVNSIRLFFVGLNILYWPLMALPQYRTQGGFPGKRYTKVRGVLWLHIIVGTFVNGVGVFLCLNNFAAGRGGVSKREDTESLWRPTLYCSMAVAGIVQAVTVFRLLQYVMGERRITVPVYAATGLINLYNGIILICNCNLESAFLLWGSMSAFVFVRLFFVVIAFAEVDYELNYTCSLLSATCTYPLSMQPWGAYLVLGLPLFYAAWHERVCAWLVWDTEDRMNNNKPAQKNIRRFAFTKSLKNICIVASHGIKKEEETKTEKQVAGRSLEE